MDQTGEGYGRRLLDNPNAGRNMQPLPNLVLQDMFYIAAVVAAAVPQLRTTEVSCGSKTVVLNQGAAKFQKVMVECFQTKEGENH